MSLAGQYSSIIAAGRVARGGPAPVAHRILQIRGRLFQARHSENAIAKTVGKGMATRDGNGKKKHAARLEERRLSCVFNLLVYTRITPPYHRAVSPSTPSLLRYVAPVIGDVSAFLRNSSDKGGRGVWRKYTRMIELFSMNYLLGRGIRF